MEITIDEGRQKKNTTQQSKLLQGFAFNDSLTYKSSGEDAILQLVDFVAFSMNRVRWILTNDKKSELDLTFLKICDRANFNILNIERRPIQFASHSVEDYDRILRETYDRNGNLSDVALEEFVKTLQR